MFLSLPGSMGYGVELGVLQAAREIMTALLNNIDLGSSSGGGGRYEPVCTIQLSNQLPNAGIGYAVKSAEADSLGEALDSGDDDCMKAGGLAEFAESVATVNGQRSLRSWGGGGPILDEHVLAVE
jgi:hypothetical protein